MVPQTPGGGGFRAVDVNNAVVTLNNVQRVQTIDEFNAQKAQFTQAVTDLQTHITQQQAQIDTLQGQVNDAQKQATGLTSANADLTQQITARDVQITQLKSQVAQATAAQPQQVAPIDLAMSFKRVLDGVQAQARQPSDVPQATLSKMDIQIKALVSVQPNTSEAVLIMPDPRALPDPNHLSTLTLSFGAVPNLRTPPGAVRPATTAPGGTPPSAAPQPAAPSATPAKAGPRAPAVAPGSAPSSPPSSGPIPAASTPASSGSLLQRLLDTLRVLGTRRRD